MCNVLLHIGLIWPQVFTCSSLTPWSKMMAMVRMPVGSLGARPAARPAFKYAAYLSKFNDCPSTMNCAPQDVTAFRWVYDPDPANLSYTPQALKPKARRYAKEQCDGYGLSLWLTEAGARDLFETIKRTFDPSVAHDRAMKVLGTHLNSLQITAAHGECDDERDDGHFTFHEYETCDLSTVATRVGPA